MFIFKSDKIFALSLRQLNKLSHDTTYKNWPATFENIRRQNYVLQAQYLKLNQARPT